MKKILIIEDESQLQSIYRQKLEGEGFGVLSAKDATVGLMMVRTHEPDLIILDIMLPGGMNGFDVLEKLKRDEKFKKIPVLVMTNLDTEEKVARQIGAADYIVKANTSLEEIMEKVKKYITP